MVPPSSLCFRPLITWITCLMVELEKLIWKKEESEGVVIEELRKF